MQMQKVHNKLLKGKPGSPVAVTVLYLRMSYSFLVSYQLFFLVFFIRPNSDCGGKITAQLVPSQLLTFSLLDFFLFSYIADK